MLSEAAFSACASRRVRSPTACQQRYRINFTCVCVCVQHKQDNKKSKPTSFGRKGVLSLKNSLMEDLYLVI